MCNMDEYRSDGVCSFATYRDIVAEWKSFGRSRTSQWGHEWRGVIRPSLWHVDDGGTNAITTSTSTTLLTNGLVLATVGATNNGGLPTNIITPGSNWTTLGPVAETAPGQFQFTDSQPTTNGSRFYRVRSP
jgi:hypothetical protein